jgi:hypothetical protein
MISLLLSGKLTVEDLPGFIQAKVDAVKTIAYATDILDRIEMARAKRAAAREQAGDADGAKHDPPMAEVKHSTRSTARIGSAKLAAVVRYLKTYREQAQDRPGISAHEKASLAKIKSMVDEMYADYVAEL